MWNEILRDVIAGCAGVLMVAAAIGLPREAAPARQQQERVQWTDTRLLPYYSRNLQPQVSGPDVRRPAGPLP